jgi:hypothetical protein
VTRKIGHLDAEEEQVGASIRQALTASKPLVHSRRPRCPETRDTLVLGAPMISDEHDQLHDANLRCELLIRVNQEFMPA